MRGCARVCEKSGDQAYGCWLSRECCHVSTLRACGRSIWEIGKYVAAALTDCKATDCRATCIYRCKATIDQLMGFAFIVELRW